MDTINSSDELQASISNLENKQLQERKELSEGLHEVYDSLKPSNLLKSAFSEIVASPEIKGNIVNASIGLTAGYLVKKLIVRQSSHPLTRIAGTVAEVGVMSFVSKHDEEIKRYGKAFLKGLIALRKYRNNRP